MHALKIISSFLVLVLATSANALPSAAILKKIEDQGVPSDALQRLGKFLYENKGRSFNQDVYTCDGASPESVRPCEEKKRRRTAKTIVLGDPQTVAIVDYSKASTEKRFFLIDLKTGMVEKFLASHGIGSGNGNFAYKFSNTKDSRQTSLGIHLTGEIYTGFYGRTLRMYGLQKSNDQAYNRDIVLHGAWYASSDFITSLHPKTKLPRGRLGVSWGCPAVATPIAKKIIPLLAGGSLIMHYHKDLLDEAQSGRLVVGENPEPVDTAPSPAVGQ